MRLPRLAYVLGFAGVFPFLLGPLWWTLTPESAPAWLDRVWLLYGGLTAAFMAGTFWGAALPAARGTAGLIGIFIAAGLLLLIWGCLLLPFQGALGGLAGVFLLLLLADFWRERTLDAIPGYFLLRSVLTVVVIAGIGWRIALPGPVVP